MSNVGHVKAAIEHARKATVLLSSWEKKTQTAAQAAKTEWGKFYAEVNQVTDDPGSGDGEGIPHEQIALYVPKVNRWTAEQWVTSAKPEFWIEGVWGGQWEFFIDGGSAGVFTGSNGSVGGVAKASYADGFHTLQGFSRGISPELVSHKILFLIDTVSPAPPTGFSIEVLAGGVNVSGVGATPYERVEVKIGPTGGGNQVDANNAWSVWVGNVPPGTWPVTVRFTDRHTNVGPWSQASPVTI